MKPFLSVALFFAMLMGLTGCPSNQASLVSGPAVAAEARPDGVAGPADSSTTATLEQSNPESTEGEKRMETATFGAGCFWGVEAAFRRTKGVKATTVGYMGGWMEKPTYKDVCTDQTGHAEVVQVQFDPNEISYDDLLNVFWENHDPTQVNRQGPDVGKQYRSVIFYHTEAQRKAAEESKKRLGESGQFRRPVATAIEPAKEFWRAEEYHQQYLEKRGLATCHI